MNHYYTKAIREQEESLAHHGIKGQKWGVRRFQNKDGTRTALGKEHLRQARAYKSEKKTGKKDKNREGTSAVSYYDNALRALGTAYRFDRSQNFQTGTADSHRAHVQDQADMRAAREAIMNRNKFYKENGEDALAGKSGEGSYQYTKWNFKRDGKLNAMVFDTATILGEPGERRTSEEEIKHAVETTNPMFSSGLYGWQNNCPACSAVLTMKKMGYSDDLIASPLHDGASATHGISQWFKGATTESVGSIDNLENTINGYGVGSFGAIGGSRYATDSEGGSVRTGGHSMGFTVLSDGKIQVECGQSGKIYGSLSEAADDQGFSTDKGFTVTRLDNTTPDFVNMAADGVLSTSNKSGNRSSSILLDTESGSLHEDTDYYSRKHAGNHNMWG